jgi:phage baseplate assembly protein gpV
VLIRGVARDSAGRVLEGAVVVVAAAPVDLPDIAALTGDDGTFVLSAPAAGRYRLEVRASGHAVHAVDVDVAAGRDVEVDATLEPDAPTAT